MAGGTFVYVSNAESQEIRVLELHHESGELTRVQELQLDVPGPLMPMAVSPDRRFLHAAQRSEPYSVATFAIDGLTGRLAQLSTAPLPHSTPYITTDRSGRWLLAASYQGGIVSVSPIGPQGVVLAPHQVLRTEPNPHSIQLDVANLHALVPSLGGDVVLQWRFDAVRGELSANQPAAVRVSEGAGPRHFAFHPNGRAVYLLNELDGTVYFFDYDPGTGLLSECQTISAMPGGFDGPAHGEKGASRNGGPKAADIHITPDGRFLYASERTTSTLNGFWVDSFSGRLEGIGSFESEQSPRGFNIDPTGHYLAAVGEASHHLTLYRIDQQSGSLITVNRYEMGRGPNWVEIIRLP